MELLTEARVAAAQPLEDEEVVRRVVAGEAALFEVLMRRHDQRLYRAVRSVLRDDDDAEDALQQAWIRIYTRLDQFQGDAAFSTWATRVALNEGLKRRREDACRRRLTPEGRASAPAAPLPDERAAARETARVLERAIDELPTPHRTVVLLRDVEGLSTSEAAAVLGISDALVKKRLERARKALRELLVSQTGLAGTEIFAFRGDRCARMVSAVMTRILAR